MYSNLIVLVSSKSKAKKIPSPDIHRFIRQISEDHYVSLLTTDGSKMSRYY